MPTMHQRRNSFQRRKLSMRYHSQTEAKASARVLFQSVREVMKDGKKMFQKFIARRGA